MNAVYESIILLILRNIFHNVLENHGNNAKQKISQGLRAISTIHIFLLKYI